MHQRKFMKNDGKGSSKHNVGNAWERYFDREERNPENSRFP